MTLDPTKIKLTEPIRNFLILCMPSRKHERPGSIDERKAYRLPTWEEYQYHYGPIDVSDSITTVAVPFMCLGCGTVYGSVTIIAPIHECPNCYPQRTDFFLSYNGLLQYITFPRDVCDILMMKFIHWVNTSIEEYERVRAEVKKREESALDDLFSESSSTTNALEDLFG